MDLAPFGIKLFIYVVLLCLVQPTEADPSAGIQPLSCDFDDNNLCSWTQDRDDDFNWILNSGDTDTSQTGPERDQSGTG